MVDIYFNCGRCAQRLVVDVQGIGLTVPCPACGTSLVIPAESAPKPVVRLFVESVPPSVDPPSTKEVVDVERLTELVRRAAQDLECEIEDEALKLVARSSNGIEKDAMWRLRIVLQYGRSGSLAPVVTAEIASEALRKFFHEKRKPESARKH